MGHQRAKSNMHKYHIVFTPKYRLKVNYKYKASIVEILREWKGYIATIIEGNNTHINHR